MYQVDKKKFEKKKNTIHIGKPKKVRNELHFMACRDTFSYVAKDKKKIIPRKQKYKEKYLDY